MHTGTPQDSFKGSLKGSFKASFKGSFRNSFKGQSAKRTPIDEERSAEGSVDEAEDLINSSLSNLLGDSFKKEFLMADSFTLNSHAEHIQSMYPISRDEQMDRTVTCSDRMEQMDRTKDDMPLANKGQTASGLDGGDGSADSGVSGGGRIGNAVPYRWRDHGKTTLVSTSWRSKWLDDAAKHSASAQKFPNLQDRGLPITGAELRCSSLTSPVVNPSTCSLVTPSLVGSGRMLTGGVYSRRASITANSSFNSLRRGSIGAGSLHHGPTKGSWLDRIARAGSSSNMLRSQMSFGSQRSSSSTSRLLQGDLEWFSDSDSLFSAQQADDNVSFGGSWVASPGMEGEIFASDNAISVSNSMSSSEEECTDDVPTDLVGGGSFRQPSATTRLLAEFASVNASVNSAALSEAQHAQQPINTFKTKANSKPFAPGFFRNFRENNAGANDEALEDDDDAFDVDAIGDKSNSLELGSKSNTLRRRSISENSLAHAGSVGKRDEDAFDVDAFARQRISSRRRSSISGNSLGVGKRELARGNAGRRSSMGSSLMGDKMVDVIGSMTNSLQNVLGSSFKNPINKMFKGSFKMSWSSKAAKARRRSRPQAETFRIVLPNGSHLSGLSTATFGNGARVQVSLNEYVLQQFVVNDRWLEFADTEQQTLFHRQHQSTQSNLRRILVGGFAVTMLFVAINFHALVSKDTSLHLLQKHASFPFPTSFLAFCLPDYVVAGGGVDGFPSGAAGSGGWGGGGEEGKGKKGVEGGASVNALQLPTQFTAIMRVLFGEQVINSHLYLGLLVLGLGGLVAGFLTSMYVGIPHARGRGGNLLNRHHSVLMVEEAQREKEEAARSRIMTRVCSIFRLGLIGHRLSYLAITIFVWHSSFSDNTTSLPPTSSDPTMSPSDTNDMRMHNSSGFPFGGGGERQLPPLLALQRSWTVDFCLCATALGSFGNGLSTRENTLLLLTGLCFLLPCIFSAVANTTAATGMRTPNSAPMPSKMVSGSGGGWVGGGSGVYLDMFDLGEGWRYLEICGNSLLFASMPALLSCLSFYFSRIETAGFLSTWIGLQLVAIQRARMGEILKNLLPLDMVDLVLSLHFQQGHESLPVTVFRERRAIVLHLDLKNYTGLTRSLLVRELAQHIDNIFRQFDTLVTDSGAKRLGLFKIDTIGDAYEAAAWLSDSYDGTCTTREEYEALQQRDVDVCRCMVRLYAATS